VHIWRRSYDVPPPNGESLKDTQERALPYYREHIEPELRAGRNVLVVAHGNSLRAIVMALEGLTPEQILKVEIPTGVPWLYELDADLKVVQRLELVQTAVPSR
jgi:2,3-bisphosphoglycerate-dependent phosphoglycerate mutase